VREAKKVEDTLPPVLLDEYRLRTARVVAT